MTPNRRRGVAVVFATLLVVSLLSTVALAGTATAQSDSADIVFVFDKTDSMDPHREALQDDIGNVADEFESKGIDARYGLVTYEEDWNTEVRQPLTSDTGELKESLNFETSGNMENASHGILTALDMEYRDDAQKIVVVITNEDDDGANNNTAVKERALQRIDDENACLVAFSPDSDRDYNDLNTYTEEVECGHWSNFDTESFTDVAAVIEEEASDGTTDDSEQTTAPRQSYPDFDIIEKSVSSNTVYTNETFTTKVVVENVGSTDGTYHALITDIDQSLYSKRVELDPGESHTFRAPISYTKPDEYRLRINHRTLDRVTVIDRQLADENVAVIERSVKRSVVMPGENYDVSVTVENTGNHSGYATVPFAAGEDANNTTHVANETVYLASGETKTVTHEATADANASGTNQIWAVENTTLGNVSVLDENDSQVGIDAYATPGAVEPNESYDVTGVVYNNANESRMVTVNVAPEHGELGALRMVAVGSDESVAVRHSTQAPSPPDNTYDLGQTNTTERASTERMSETWWVNDQRVNVTVITGPSN
ncbi:VWA domain-containing protein [Natronomonas sp. CBA1123]|uniref:vWA domain-containing protein n=1 Tax=Natronomonas sp. CBA1123 TaxID=2668070 RepID=UPI0012E9BD74|nr:vWA domain-containing protein [Natronomonas sp. CBA1123]MUV85103.1 VWA domain-containing protein [Natronomonas sp. CBA1123]